MPDGTERTCLLVHRTPGSGSLFAIFFRKGRFHHHWIMRTVFRNNSTPEGIDGKTVSDFLLRGRRRYRELLEKDYEAGTETRKTRYPLVLPTMVPMRHSRCIKGRFVLDGGMEQARFPDSIGLAPTGENAGMYGRFPTAVFCRKRLRASSPPGAVPPPERMPGRSPASYRMRQ